MVNHVNIPVTVSENNQSDFPFDQTFSTQDTPSEDYESRDEITFVYMELIKQILDYILSGNNSRRSLSVFILAILKLFNYFLNFKILNLIKYLGNLT